MCGGSAQQNPQSYYFNFAGNANTTCKSQTVI